MAFNRKTSRSLVIDEVPFLWRVARHIRDGLHFLDILVAREDVQGATLIQPVETLITDLVAPSITPAEVKDAILRARNFGWKETEPGPQFRLRPRMLLEGWFNLPAPNPGKSPAHTLLRIYHSLVTAGGTWVDGSPWVALHGRDRRAWTRDMLEPGSGYPDFGKAFLEWGEQTGKEWGRISKDRFGKFSTAEIAALYHQEMEARSWATEWKWQEEVTVPVPEKAGAARLDDWWSSYLEGEDRAIAGAMVRTHFDAVYFFESKPTRAIFIQIKTRFIGSLELPE